MKPAEPGQGDDLGLTNGATLRWTARGRGLGKAQVGAVVVVVGDVGPKQAKQMAVVEDNDAVEELAPDASAPDPVLRVVENAPDAAKATQMRSRRAGQKKQIPALHVVAGASSEPTGSLDPAVTGNDRSVTGKPKRLSTLLDGAVKP